MAYTVAQLVNTSYYLAGIVSRQFESVEGQQLQEGVDVLNDILADMTVDDGMIPYMTNSTFTGVVGQEAYPITDLISVDTLVFYLDNVRYEMIPLSRDKYFGTGRVENINSLPYNYQPGS